MAAPTTWDLELRGAGGEPVDLWRTLTSHGMTELPPLRLDQGARTLEITLATGRGRARTVTISQGPRGRARITAAGPPPSDAAGGRILGAVRHVLRLDEDLAPFYALATKDPDLAWAAAGAGRMIRSPTVFEDVVKTVCTTNCAWSSTERMVGAIVEHLGVRAPGAPASGPWGRAFPTPDAMVAAGERFYRDVARAGYRASYLLGIAGSVGGNDGDLESLSRATREDVPDEAVEAQLLRLPGVGPYAAAHIMMTLGRHSRLILDSWSRPKYARLVGKRSVPDAAIARRFRAYGRYAGLAFWLFITRDWVDD